MLRLQESGLIAKWVKIYQPGPHQCLDPSHRQQQEADLRNPTLLNLDNFAGTFAALLLGYLLSMFAFLRENYSKIYSALCYLCINKHEAI